MDDRAFRREDAFGHRPSLSAGRQLKEEGDAKDVYERVPAAIQRLQGLVGNRAVARLLAESRGAPSRRWLSRHADFPVGVGGSDSSVWFEWSVRWKDDDRTGSVKMMPGILTPGLNDRLVSQEVSDEHAVDRQKLVVRPNRTGILVLEAVAHFHVDVPHGNDQDYSQKCSVECSLTTPGGKLQFGALAPTISAKVDQEDPWVRITNVTPTVNEKSGEVAITVSFAGSQFSSSSGTSHTVTVGGGGGGKYVNVSGSYGDTTSSGTGRSDPAALGSHSFVAEIKVPTPPRPDPTGTVEIGSVRGFIDKTFDVDFKSPKNHVLDLAERRRLLDWYFGLSRLTRSRLKSGAQHMELEAFTSQTQPADKNQKLAEQRQAAVIGVIGRFVDPENWVKHATAYGEDLLPDDTPGKQPKEDPTMWSVRLKVVDEVTPDAKGFDDTASFEDLMPQ